MSVIVSDSSNPKYGTGVYTVTVNNAGSGYSPSDVLTLTGGDANATVTVLTVGGSGEVLTISRTTVGSGYSAGTESTSGGGGSSCTIDITVQSGLGTVNGFYRIESYNLTPSTASPIPISTSTPSTMGITFANAGNCLGAILILRSASTTINTGNLTLTLQENVASTWTDRATKTLTPAEMLAGKDDDSTYNYLILAIPFEFTSSYTIDTSAGKWRLSLIASVSSMWQWLISSTNNFCYAVWCDNAVSFTNNDVLIIKDLITIDQSATLVGVTGNGQTTYSCCGFICSSFDLNTKTKLQWENPPINSYTLTLDGYFILYTHSGIAIGSSSNPIPFAQQAIVIVKQTPTAGTAGNSGFTVNPNNSVVSSYVVNRCAEFFMYGEIPTYTHTTLASDANTSQPNLITVDSTGWSIGDEIVIGKQNTKGIGEIKIYTIDSISGTNITLTGNITTNNRIAGGIVATRTGYGIHFKSDIAATSTQALGSFTKFVLQGVRLTNIYIIQ